MPFIFSAPGMSLVSLRHPAESVVSYLSWEHVSGFRDLKILSSDGDTFSANAAMLAMLSAYAPGRNQELWGIFIFDSKQ